jgi:hypothetical protein
VVAGGRYTQEEEEGSKTFSSITQTEVADLNRFFQELAFQIIISEPNTVSKGGLYTCPSASCYVSFSCSQEIDNKKSS